MPLAHRRFRPAPSNDDGRDGATRGAPVPRVVEISVNPGPTAPAAARHAVECLSALMPRSVHDDLRLVASELVTYGVLNGQASERYPMVLRIARLEGRTRMEIEAGGRGSMTTAAHRLGQDDTSRLRLKLLERVGDRWGVLDRNGTVVWLEIDDRPGVEAAPR
jgi:hypothetical protein